MANMLKTALVQLCVGDDPHKNLSVTQDLIAKAHAAGAQFILTPEVTNCIALDRAVLDRVTYEQGNDPTLAALRAQARALGVHILIGSIGIKTGDADGRLANRSFMIGPDGHIIAQYDKIHMFDVDVSPTETYRESASFRPGDRAVLAHTAFGTVGMTICYDLRFAHLHRALAQAGAQILTVPAAFSSVTGAAHWEVLLRARAIETGCFVLAPAQCGQHSPKRRSYGHSLAVAPWGEVLADGGEDVGFTLVDLDLDRVAEARRRVAAIRHDRPFAAPVAAQNMRSEVLT